MSVQGLFRVNAIKQQSARLDGEVIVVLPVSAGMLTLVALCVAISILVFLSLASFNRKETVSGYLKPDVGLAKVVSSRSGVVQSIFVEDGQQVQAGERLALLRMPDAADRSLFARIVPTIRDIGLWGPRIRKAYADMGILGFAEGDVEGMGLRDEVVAKELDARLAEITSTAEQAAAT